MHINSAKKDWMKLKCKYYVNRCFLEEYKSIAYSMCVIKPKSPLRFNKTWLIINLKQQS